MSKRGNCKFNGNFTEEFPCIIACRDDQFKATCTVCKFTFPVRNKGKFDESLHISSKKHQNIIK